MGNDNTGRLPECIRQHRNEDTDCDCFGLDRYSWNQGQNAKYDFQVFENQEPALVARGGGSGCICYQEKVGALCSTDHKWIQQQQVMQGKLIVCRRTH